MVGVSGEIDRLICPRWWGFVTLKNLRTNARAPRASASLNDSSTLNLSTKLTCIENCKTIHICTYDQSIMQIPPIPTYPRFCYWEACQGMWGFLSPLLPQWVGNCNFQECKSPPKPVYTYGSGVLH